MVVAIRATEVTVGKEKDRAEFPRPIHKRGFQKSFDVDYDGSAWDWANIKVRQGSWTDTVSPPEGLAPLLSN